MDLLKLTEISVDEAKALSAYGFDDDELMELNSLKEELLTTETELEKMLTLAAFGLSYFVHDKFSLDHKVITISPSTVSYMLTASDFAKCAIVQCNKDNQPLKIIFGFRIDEKTVHKLDEINAKNLDYFKLFKLYRKLTSYAFLTDKTNITENPTLKDTISGYIVRPLTGDAGIENLLIVDEIKEEVEETEDN